MLAARPVVGHEFWIDPTDYTVAPGAPLVADLRNGEAFEGMALARIDNRFTRFEIVFDGQARAAEGRMGDRPALQITVPERPGLLVILHETTPSTLTYRDWEKFLKFAKHKNFTKAAAAHDAAGWPREGFRESYTRHAKALIAVGDGAGEDRAFGLATEFVALSNPYAADPDGRMRVRLLYDGAPRADAQVEVFDRAPDGAVSVRLTRTDAAGEAVIDITPGHDYLLDAVVLRPAADAGTSDHAPVWETLWAALSFAVPE